MQRSLLRGRNQVDADLERALKLPKSLACTRSTGLASRFELSADARADVNAGANDAGADCLGVPTPTPPPARADAAGSRALDHCCA